MITEAYMLITKPGKFAQHELGLKRVQINSEVDITDKDLSIQRARYVVQICGLHCTLGTFLHRKVTFFMSYETHEY